MLKKPYAVYMEMWHNTVEGDNLLLRLRVAEAATHEEAVVWKQRFNGSDLCFAELSSIGRDVMRLNPQAGAIKTTFVVAFEGK